MMMFGAFYYVMPRMLDSEWHSARLIKVHFWASAVGMSIYWIGLTWGGWIQGQMMNDPNIPFLAIVKTTLPYLHSRTAAGILMSIGHIAFAILVWNMLRPPRSEFAWADTPDGETQEGRGREGGVMNRVTLIAIGVLFTVFASMAGLVIIPDWQYRDHHLLPGRS